MGRRSAGIPETIRPRPRRHCSLPWGAVKWGYSQTSVQLLDLRGLHPATADTPGCRACVRLDADFRGTPGEVGLWAPLTRPTWIRGSTSSSSSRPCSILSSSSSSFSSTSRAGGGTSAGSSERFRFSTASMRAAERSAAGSQSARWDPSARRAASPQPCRSGRAALPPRCAAGGCGAAEEVGAAAPCLQCPAAHRSRFAPAAG